ncbi:MAG: hypothetical protein LBM23_03455 [Propionibacteriaceae bacterium]|jgi:hypothetical protein|nr:hypothetical protein [Propionibacteriaceae bacterium]
MNDLQAVVFLDGNILAKPVTRSLLMFAADASGYSVVWSDYAEREGDSHLRESAKSLAFVRKKAGQSLSPTGDGAEQFFWTSQKDRQILADAVAAKAHFIVTEDVDDFGEEDLDVVGLAVVNHDLFLAERVTRLGYARALRLLSERMKNPSRTPEELHVVLGKLHPLTVAAHRLSFDAEPLAATHNPPNELYRGNRCLRCLMLTELLQQGVCTRCRPVS